MACGWQDVSWKNKQEAARERNRRLPEKETVVYSKEIEYNRRVGCRLCKKTGE